MVSVLAVLFFGFLPLSQQAIYNSLLGVDTGGECTVVDWKNFNLSSSIDINILSYITPDNHIKIRLSFQDHDDLLYLDDLLLYSHQITRFKKRDSYFNKTSTSVHIPEGWNQLKLMVTDKNVSLEWKKGKNNVSLLALPLDLPIAVVFLRGNFSVCSGVSPEWDVNERKEIIQLQPLENEQLLEVTGNGSLLVDDETFTVTQPPRFANTTLITQTWRQNSHSTISIKEDGKQGNWTWGKPETPWPQMTVRSEEGVTHLRLIQSDACASDKDSDASTSDNDNDASASDKDSSSNILESFMSMMVIPTYGITHVFAFLFGAMCAYCVYVRSALKRKNGGETGQNQEEQNQETVLLTEIRSSGGDNSSSPVISYEQESSGHGAHKTARKILGKSFLTVTSDNLSKSIKKRSTST